MVPAIFLQHVAGFPCPDRTLPAASFAFAAALERRTNAAPSITAGKRPGAPAGARLAPCWHGTAESGSRLRTNNSIKQSMSFRCSCGWVGLSPSNKLEDVPKTGQPLLACLSGGPSVSPPVCTGCSKSRRVGAGTTPSGQCCKEPRLSPRCSRGPRWHFCPETAMFSSHLSPLHEPGPPSSRKHPRDIFLARNQQSKAHDPTPDL